jgi:hypothetical protein
VRIYSGADLQWCGFTVVRIYSGADLQWCGFTVVRISMDYLLNNARCVCQLQIEAQSMFMFVYTLANSTKQAGKKFGSKTLVTKGKQRS